ncbi:hypothetical protein [Pseudomonas extremaustralis]|uniref:hypothetical protein n=1 Tax=Pseudomonas extremaustralis TaxID=359110 RepID=UPI002FE3DB61
MLLQISNLTLPLIQQLFQIGQPGFNRLAGRYGLGSLLACMCSLQTCSGFQRG